MTDNDLQAKLNELGPELDVPGVAAAIYLDGSEIYAFHGVTSVENPLTVDEKTMFQFGSTGKTFTATAMLRLVDQGKVDLDAPVRTYLPELRLKDESVAERVTVLQLFNHTGGWDGDFIHDTGDGDDALARYVELMADLEQVTPLGATVSYNNAALSLAGRVIEKVTGTSYEQAMRDLVLTPLGLDNTYFFAGEMITRRFAVGHTRHEDGHITVNRPWPLPRSNAAAGGMSATASDQITWAKLHLGDGTASDGSRFLPAELIDRMKQPTADMRGSALGDYVGISWLLRDVDGVRLVGHGGTTNGQHSEFTMVPERNFAVISMTNCGPNGPKLNQDLTRWALKHYLDIDDVDPEPVSLGDDALNEYTGRFETIALTYDVTADNGQLLAKATLKEAFIAALYEDGAEIPDEPPLRLGLLDETSDRYVIPEGPAQGMRGYFTRDAGGRIVGIHLGGRLAERATAPTTGS